MTLRGTDSDGQPLGVIPGAATYGITATPVDAAATWAALDGEIFDAGSGITEWDGLAAQMGAAVVTPNALAAPAGDPLAATAILTTTAGGFPPLFIAMWGGVDLIRDPYTDAKAGGLRITGLVTADVTVARGSQVEILTGLR